MMKGEIMHGNKGIMMMRIIMIIPFFSFSMMMMTSRRQRLTITASRLRTSFAATGNVVSVCGVGLLHSLHFS